MWFVFSAISWMFSMLKNVYKLVNNIKRIISVLPHGIMVDQGTGNTYISSHGLIQSTLFCIS